MRFYFCACHSEKKKKEEKKNPSKNAFRAESFSLYEGEYFLFKHTTPETQHVSICESQ